MVTLVLAIQLHHILSIIKRFCKEIVYHYPIILAGFHLAYLRETKHDLKKLKFKFPLYQKFARSAKDFLMIGKFWSFK